MLGATAGSYSVNALAAFSRRAHDRESGLGNDANLSPGFLGRQVLYLHDPRFMATSTLFLHRARQYRDSTLTGCSTIASSFVDLLSRLV